MVGFNRFVTICAVAGLLCITISVAISVLIDPYNVFHLENIRDNGIEPNKNYIKVNYLLKNPDKFDSLIVGSSHVGALHVERMENEHCYNMTCPEQLPCEALANLKSLIAGGYMPQKIYLGIDSWAYRGDPELHKTDKRTIAYETLQNPLELYKTYIDPHNAFFSLFKTFTHKKDSAFQNKFYEYGWMIDYDMEAYYDWSKIDEYNAGITNRLTDTLSELKDYVRICEENKIQLVIFSNPYCKEQYEADLENGYLEFLRGVAMIHPFINFAGLNAYTIDHGMFIDPTHYNAYLGDKMLTVIITGVADETVGKTWGMYVNAENLNDFLRIMKSRKPSE